MSMTPPQTPERLVKSVERVRDLGEVFTPAATVKAMLDLIPEAMWVPHPSFTFLESLRPKVSFPMRPEQQDAVDVTAAYFRAHENEENPPHFL